ncbi:reverse transcriptase family protein [Kineosporia babensis]|uniref:RNA-directed DNA polymerase n=1 Tax=Kineosporia babensis TaxID=499548 RepID=A0A9X1NAX5_9ACTN|nr:reverse transcriptase family protein [Kineosporia babensis]MCD5310763.1 reverse transcriptase family protein [Kineosporia babensis]
MSDPRTRVLARALGNAFLTAPEWALRPLTDNAATVLGGRRRWTRRLAREVLDAYPRPPADRPRELAAFIQASPILFTAVLRSVETGRPLRVIRMPPAPVQMNTRRPWPVPKIDSIQDLARLLDLETAQLDWFADVKGLQRRAAPGPLHHYRYAWASTASKRPRLLEAPLPRLRSRQRTLLEQILARIPTHPAAHGFVPGRSAVTGAEPHAGAAVVIGLDLAAFFASIQVGQVYGIFRAAGYAEPVAHVLTGLCTTRTPVRVISNMPATSDVESRVRLRRLLAGGHLPQGAPTSPALANLCALGLDRRLNGLAAAVGMTYTRYADDLTFSAGEEVNARRLITAVDEIVRSEGFALQSAKTRIRRDFQRQEVTGIVVNAHPNLNRREYDELKAILHNALRHGPEGQNRAGHRDFRAHLLGRIAWVAQLNPERGRKLRETFEAITWPSLS